MSSPLQASCVLGCSPSNREHWARPAACRVTLCRALRTPPLRDGAEKLHLHFAETPGTMRTPACAVLLLAVAAALAAGAGAAPTSARRLAQIAGAPAPAPLAQATVPRPGTCALSDLDFQAALASLEADCPREAPYSCPEPCIQTLQAVRYASPAWRAPACLHVHLCLLAVIRTFLLCPVQLNYRCAVLAAVAAAKASGADPNAAADRM